MVNGASAEILRPGFNSLVGHRFHHTDILLNLAIFIFHYDKIVYNIFLFHTIYDQRISGFIFCEDVPKISFSRLQASALVFFLLPLKIFKTSIFSRTEAWHYLETLQGFGLFPVITKPTRVTATSQTLIDHIFTNITARTVTSGIYQYDITDHFPIFCQIHNNAPKHKTFNKRGFYRDYAAAGQTLFEEDINAIFENEPVLAPLNNENNVKSVLEQLISLFKSVVDKQAHIKRASRKKHKLLKKPWITKGILVSIKNKQKMYKTNFLNGNDAQKLLFKTYSNKLTKPKSLTSVVVDSCEIITTSAGS